MATAASSNEVKYLNQSLFNGGISPSPKLNISEAGAFAFGQRLNIFDEASQMTVMPASVLNSGSGVVTDLIEWGVSGVPYDTNTYFLGSTGNFYELTSGGTWSLIQNIPNCHGEGMNVFYDTSANIYIRTDSDVATYGPLGNSPTMDLTWGSTLAAAQTQPAFSNLLTTGWGPILPFTDGLAIGNGEYLAFYAFSSTSNSWQLATQETSEDGSISALQFPAGLNVRCLEIIDQYLQIGTWTGTNITANDQGYLFQWDGLSPNPNYFFANPQGGMNFLLNNKNRLLSMAGGNGQLLMNYQPFLNIQTMPKQTIQTYLEVYPGAANNYRGLAQIGVAANTNSSTIVEGVYTYGSQTQLYPEVLNLSWTISTGNTTNINIGLIFAFGNNLYIAWQDNNGGTTYGVDLVSTSNNFYSNAVFESLIFDNSQLYKDKQANVVKVHHLPLNTGESIQVGYKINRAASYTYGAVNSTVGSVATRLPIGVGGSRFREFQGTVILNSPGTTTPTVTYFGLEFNTLGAEAIF